MTSTPELSELVEVDLRKVWNHEARCFTPWLAKELRPAVRCDRCAVGARRVGGRRGYLFRRHPGAQPEQRCAQCVQCHQRGWKQPVALKAINGDRDWANVYGHPCPNHGVDS